MIRIQRENSIRQPHVRQSLESADDITKTDV